MRASLSLFTVRIALVLWVLVGSSSLAGQDLESDQTAFKAARAVAAPSERVEALKAYLARYPGGSRSAQADELLLATYLHSFPEQTDAIRKLAEQRIQAASPGLDRWMEQAHTADLLADAAGSSTDLSAASVWAKDAVSSLTLPAYRHELALMGARFHLSALFPQQVQHMFAYDRATCLAALANVLLRQGKSETALPYLREARQLDAHSSEIERLRGQYELSKGNAPEALKDMLRANALGPLTDDARTQEEELYRRLQHGGSADLDRQVDLTYASIFPKPYQLPPHTLPAGGHTVLLELFTGSDCAPCAGPDLAVESLLHTYSRSDLVALEFDEHVPYPDPLATPETAERAAFYGVEATPAAFVDGTSTPLAGGSRDDVENIVVGLADEIEAQASLPSDLQLSLTAARGPDGVIRIEPSLKVNAAAAKDTDAHTSLRTLQQARLFVALAEDNLRYPGKNGIRFHRMVVRSIHDVPAATAMAGGSHQEAVVFDPQSISKAQEAYLADYQEHNDRYGHFTFAAAPTVLNPEQLAVVAWIQDPTTRKVLQSAYIAVPSR